MSDAPLSLPRSGPFRNWRRITRAVPLLVWCGSIVAVVILFPQSRLKSSIRGVVDAQHHVVRAPAAGRLVAINVDLHEPVRAGQVIGRLGDDEVRLRLAQARLEMERLRADIKRRDAELQAVERSDDARRQLDTNVELRRRATDLETAHLDELATRAEIEETRIRLRGVTIESDRVATLLTQQVASDSEAIRLRTERDALGKRIAELEILQREQHSRAEASRQRLSQFTSEANAAVPRELILEPFRWQLKIHETELERITFDLSRLDLTAPCNGRVASLACQAGHWLQPGDSVLTVTEPAARRILAYVPESLRDHVLHNPLVHVFRPDRPGSRRATSVRSISPALVAVPRRLLRDPRLEEWAWEIVLDASGDEAPGESIHLFLTP